MRTATNIDLFGNMTTVSELLFKDKQVSDVYDGNVQFVAVKMTDENERY